MRRHMVRVRVTDKHPLRPRLRFVRVQPQAEAREVKRAGTKFQLEKRHPKT